MFLLSQHSLVASQETFLPCSLNTCFMWLPICIKKAWTVRDFLFYAKGSGKTVDENKHETAHAIWREPLAYLFSHQLKFTRFYSVRIRALSSNIYYVVKLYVCFLKYYVSLSYKSSIHGFKWGMSLTIARLKAVWLWFLMIMNNSVTHSFYDTIRSFGVSISISAKLLIHRDFSK